MVLGADDGQAAPKAFSCFYWKIKMGSWFFSSFPTPLPTVAMERWEPPVFPPSLAFYPGNLLPAVTPWTSCCLPHPSARLWSYPRLGGIWLGSSKVLPIPGAPTWAELCPAERGSPSRWDAGWSSPRLRREEECSRF